MQTGFIRLNGMDATTSLKFAYNTRKFLFGNICCAQTLPYGNAFDVEDETLEIIATLAPHGGIFIGSSSEVHDAVPVENAWTMYEAVHDYGQYPIDLERIHARRRDIRDRLVLRAGGALS